MLAIRNIGCILLQAVLSLKINMIFCAFDWGQILTNSKQISIQERKRKS